MNLFTRNLRNVSGCVLALMVVRLLLSAGSSVCLDALNNGLANTKDKRVRVMSMFAMFCLGAYCGHCVSVTSARERIEKRRWFKYHC